MIQINSQSTILGMNTAISYSVFGENSDFALKAAEDETNRLEGILSRFMPTSDISRINGSAGIKSQKVSRDTLELLSKAVQLSKACGGCFDVTIGPLSLLWTESRDKAAVPDASTIENALPLVDYKDLLLHRSLKSVGLKKVGQSIDLGGIAKGYAADKVLEVLKKHGVTSAYANFGGNVATIGSKPDGSAWRVGIQHPRLEGELVGVVSVINSSVVTSGDYQRFFIGIDGKRYHHILDPATGYPSDSGLISATVVSNSSMSADALSTMLFVSGIEKGIKVLKCFPDTEALLIDKDLNIYITRGLTNSFQPRENFDIKIIN